VAAGGTGVAMHGSSNERMVVIGAGPTGLGAAHRLQELGHDDFVVLEANDYVGGLATSFTDDAGFTYDIGGHVMFSHYDYYDSVVEGIMGEDYTELQREAWVWMENRFTPYPFQNNIKDLEPATVLECIMGLIEAQKTPAPPPRNFADWMRAVFGAGITRHFMEPYNFKVWATPAELMNFVWIGERVSVVDVEAVLRNVVFDEPAVSWGPNNTFRYPLRGGTGTLYRAMHKTLQDRIELNCAVTAIDIDAKVVHTTDGRRWPYDRLLNTMPLTTLVGLLSRTPDAVRAAAGDLVWSGSHIVGVGLDRPAESTKNWIYFPEPDVPFYRVTYLSNYSPYMTAEPDQTLLLTETSRSRFKPSDPATVVDEVIDGLVATHLMSEDDRNRVVTTWRCSPDRSYPVPSVGRDAALGTIQPWLRSQDITSRGRFGAWLYEIGNMDHSFMQGVEWVDHAVDGTPETTWIPRGESAAGDGIR
jgi:protoporphyrinogen oxidase